MSDILERLNSALAGRYTIDRELGRGGMAVVYLARDERHQRLVAIKVMLPEVVGEVGAERFRREIQIAARLTHPHIVTVFDSGDADGLFFYAMPFIEGESLADAIVRARQLSIGEAVSIARQVAEALDYAHAEGVVHRDIKPANILLAKSRPRTGGGSSGRSPVVTDFGIARAMTGEAAERLTRTGLMIGTPTYMSPEQWGGSSEDIVDGRADQYSLGCVLYEMLIGEPPFSGSNPMVVLARHTREMVPSLRLVRPTIPEALEQAVFRSMSKVPADRYDTIGDFADAIAASLEGGINYGSTADHAIQPNTGNLPVRVATDQHALVRQPHMMATGLVDPRAPTALFQTPAQAVPQLRRPMSPMKRRVAVVGGASVLALGAAFVSFKALRGDSKPPAPQQTRVLVMPFDNRGPIGDSAFADGLTEEVISRLSGVPRLGVVARTSAMKYKNTPKTLGELGSELNVTKIVEGTVIWKANAADARQATVSVRIVSLPSEVETPVGDRFDVAKLNDIYSIASAVAAKLDVTKGLADEVRKRLIAEPTKNREAYEAYVAGNRFFNHSWELSDVDAAIAEYERATQLDSNFALAWAGLGRAHGWKYQLNYDRSETRIVFAKLAVDRALKLGPDLPEAHLAEGLYRYWCRRDYDGALAQFDTVRRALPSSAEASNFIGNILRRKGDLQDAADNYQLAADFDPRAHQPVFNRAEVLLYLRKFEEANKAVDRVIDLAPDFLDAYLLKATLQIHRTGDVAQARTLVDVAEKQVPPAKWRLIGLHWRSGLFRMIDDSLASAQRRIVVGKYGLDTAGYYLAKSEMYRTFGRADRATVYDDSARKFLDGMIKQHPDWWYVYGQLGMAYAGLGRKPDAIRTAERGLQELNEKTDALDGPEWYANLAQIHLLFGDKDKALDNLEKMMHIPSRLSSKWIELDPAWVALRQEPRFQRLLRETPPGEKTVALSK